MIRWGVIGVGIAGRARARALAADPRATPVLGYRGSPEAVGLEAAPSAAAVIAAVDAVAICAPDEAHPALVEAALRAGKHVVCEFPLAATARDARRLLDLARQQGTVLHVEHIELLGGAAQWLRAHAPQPTAGLIGFTSARASAPIAIGNLARVHRIMDVLGAPDALRIDLRAPKALQGALRFGGVEIALDFRFAPGLPRETRLRLDTPQGTVAQHNRTITLDGTPVALPQTGGLFAADQRHATARILDGAPPYVSEARLIAALALVEALDHAPLGAWLPLR